MKKVPRIVYSEKYLVNYLDESGKKVFSDSELIKLFDENRSKWGLPVTVSSTKLIGRFINRGVFTAVSIEIGQRKIERYFYKDPGIYELAISLRAKSYISHYPALLLNDLTNQIPKTIYTTHELSQKPKRPIILTQEGIDSAFSKPQRRSETEFIYNDYKIVLLEGKFTGKAGVIVADNIAYTNLERTLIDATVRPNYSGGSHSVLEAYRNAVSKKISVNKIAAFLTKMDFIYPYHQAVGFYLEQAGYTGNLLDLLRRKPMEYDFYLDYDMGEMDYSDHWKIYYPKGM